MLEDRQFGTAAEVAQALGVTPARIHQLCRAGRVVGAAKSDGVWVIPMHPQVVPATPERPHPYRRGLRAITPFPGQVAAPIGAATFL